MLTLQRLSSSLLVLAITALPVMAGSNDDKTASGNTANAANTTTAEAAPAAVTPSLTPTASDANVTALLGVLVMKGVLSAPEANAVRNTAPNAQFQALVEALSRKGVVSAADLSAIANPTAQPSAPAAVPVAVRETVSASASSPEPAQAQPVRPGRVAGELAPPPSGVIPAVIPVRVLPIDHPKTYGFVKATVVHDSSNPDGDDFPGPGLFFYATSLTNTGPTKDPEFHIKARSTRFGLNLEWPDISPKVTVTGKIEGDFEGNYNESANADVTSIRNPNPRLRLAAVRIDYHASENTDIFFVGGQDWTLFGSGALPNLIETTLLGGFYGSVYTRSPQLRGGFIQTLSNEHNIKLEPQFGILMPSSGQVERLGTSFSNGLQNQIGQAEREGADSDRPEYEGRVALSFQLDNARGVAPAQIAVAGFYGRRTSIVPNSSYITAGTCDLTDANYCSAFPNGFQASSKQYGGQITLQLPTRWFTLVGSAYRGGDLRFYAGSQINSYFTNINGLFNLTNSLVTTDGGPYAVAGGAALGCNINPGTGACPTTSASGCRFHAGSMPIRRATTLAGSFTSPSARTRL